MHNKLCYGTVAQRDEECAAQQHHAKADDVADNGCRFARFAQQCNQRGEQLAHNRYKQEYRYKDEQVTPVDAECQRHDADNDDALDDVKRPAGGNDAVDKGAFGDGRSGEPPAHVALVEVIEDVVNQLLAREELEGDHKQHGEEGCHCGGFGDCVGTFSQFDHTDGTQHIERCQSQRQGDVYQQIDGVAEGAFEVVGENQCKLAHITPLLRRADACR